MKIRGNARHWITIVPIILVNAVALTGQFAFLRDHLSWGIPGDIVFAAALESVAIYLAYHAHAALIADDSAFRLRFASYAFAFVIGAMNYSHYSNDWRPTFEAVAVGLMSAASPWLWAIHSRRESRNILIQRGYIEPHSLRMGMTRWLWHPGKSFRVMQQATWTGERNVPDAIAIWEASQTVPEPPGERMTLDTAASDADAIRVALRETGEGASAPDVARWLAERGRTVTPAYVRSVRAAQGRRAASERRNAIHSIGRPALPAPGTGPRPAAIPGPAETE